ncbi:DUF1176 domain-containing protein [Uliginosibacterium sp. 31-16]|uniref:DUF1176 domain-containing protein n=1 Tax=Uliginosibacterium sp. 31-16 TaxID=3068315 RepID=UPI00273F412E|nr:DUF1176 domain-containing protein [Uliginosibacterium sp. 31-16]MDP5240224.1 DUF1176 domain-containing protein [Uliginosibacterium sp. 31-16]
MKTCASVHQNDTRHFLAARAPLLALVAALAASPASAGFQHKDWELQCDNTRTCRAAGYQAEDGDSDPVSILITRAAGPSTPIEISVQVYSEQGVTGPLQLRAGKLLIKDLKGDTASIASKDSLPLVQQLLNIDTATLRAGKSEWTLSLAGIKAVLLKMDEEQGRIGTPGALVRKGTKPESSVLPALPLPVIIAVTPLPARKADDGIGKRALKALSQDIAEQCNEGKEALANASTTRIDEHRLLLSVPCGVGAYNSTALNWIINDRAPGKPEGLEAEGDFDAGTGSISSAMKGRGIGDCWSMTSWQFDGKAFVVTEQSGDGMCRGFPGGAWQLPAYVSKVVPADKAKR